MSKLTMARGGAVSVISRPASLTFFFVGRASSFSSVMMVRPSLARKFHRILVRQVRVAFEAQADVELGDQVTHARRERADDLVKVIYATGAHAAGVKVQHAINVGAVLEVNAFGQRLKHARVPDR